MIDVYYAPPSIYGRKVLAVLEEKELDYTIKKMSFATEDHLKPEYLQVNPNGEIPAINDDGQIIYESTAIAEYLNDEYPNPPLMPEDSYSRAKVRMIDDFCDLYFYKSIVKALIKKVYKKEELTEEDIQSCVSHLKRIEDYLGKSEYIVGNFSLADCAVMVAIASLDNFGWKDRVDNFSPAIKKYAGKLRMRRSYLKGAALKMD